MCWPWDGRYPTTASTAQPKVGTACRQCRAVRIPASYKSGAVGCYFLCQCVMAANMRLRGAHPTCSRNRASGSCSKMLQHFRHHRWPDARPQAAALEAVQLTPAVAQPVDMVHAFRNVRGLLFDIDGTLGNSEPLHFQVYQETLMEEGFNNGHPITHQFFMENIGGRHNPVIAAELFPHKSEEWRTAWSEMREARFRALAQQGLAPINGLHNFQEWVEARGLRRAAVTNAPRLNAEVMVHGLGLHSFFETLVIGEECLRAKPHPDPYLEGLVRLGLRHAADQVLVLEDSPAGIHAAGTAGLKVVGIASARPAEGLYDAGASLVVQDYDELMAWLARHGL